MVDPTFLAALVVAFALAIFLITLINTDFALVLLVVAMLFSPEIGIADIGRRSVVIRLDDMLIFVIFFTWLAKLAVNKQMGVLKHTPINIPLALFMFSCILSTGIGILSDQIRSPVAAFFYSLKYVEYFLLYFLVSNVIRTREQLKHFIVALLVTAVCVALYGYWQMLTYGPNLRISTPFEGKGEPNTLAAYLILMMSLAAGLGLYAKSAPKRLVFLGAVLFLSVPFIFTYSRMGYGVIVVLYVLLCFIAKRYRMLLIAGLVGFLIIAPHVLPNTVFERVSTTFDRRIGAGVEIGGIELAESPAARIVIWKRVVREFMASPIFGLGVTGIGFLDSQYATLLGEQGLFGLVLLLWIFWRLGIHTHHTFRQNEDPLIKGLCLGFQLMLIAMFLFSFAMNAFIVIRVVEPFWFMAAMVMAARMFPKEYVPMPGPAVAARMR